MEVKAVSALRGKSGLHRVNGAEPQVVGLASLTTEERKTGTMKTYILRDPKPVEPQKAIRPPRQKPAAPKTADLWPRFCGRRWRSIRWGRSSGGLAIRTFC